MREIYNRTRSSIEGSPHNERHSLQLFVVEFDPCLVWELLLLPSNAQTAPNSPTLFEGNLSIVLASYI